MLKIKDAAAAKNAAASVARKGQGQTPDFGAASSLNVSHSCPKRISKALKAYIASYRNSQHPPPCRSYRNLMTLVEFQEFFKKIELAEFPADLVAVKNEVKPFKESDFQ